MNKIKALVLFTVFIDIIGIGVIIPVMPYYVQSFGASDAVVTLLIAMYALLSFFSSPVLGALSDRWGRRPILIISIISSAIGWIMFAGAQSILWLFVGRGIDGLAAGNITAAQSSLADIAKDEQERTTNMGLIGMMFGIGLVVGPLLGGFLGSLGHSVPFWFVGCLASANAILAYFFFPETHATKNSDHVVSMNPLKPIIDGFQNREMRALFGIWFLFGIGIAIQQSTFALYVSRVFGASEKTVGLLFGAVGLIILINQVVLLKRVWLKYFKEKTLAQIMLGMFAIGMITLSVPTVAVFAIALLAITLGQGTTRTVFTSLIAGFNPNKRGEYLGISMSVMSLSMVVGPLISSVTFGWNPHIPFVIAGLFAFAGMIVMWMVPLRHVR